jgi:hypothetical protein
MQLIRPGHGLAALVGVLLTLMAVSAVAEEIIVKPPRNAADVIRGHGGQDGLSGEDIRNYVALTWAEARATALIRLMRADLDGNGAVGGDEAVVYQDSLSARSRARFGRDFEAADLNLDLHLSGDEVATFGASAAWAALNREDEAALAGLLGLDADGDGAVDLDELRTGLVRAGAVKAPKGREKDV